MVLKGVVFDLDHTLFDRYATIMALKDVIFSHMKDYIAEGVTPEQFAASLCQSDKNHVTFGWPKIFEDMCRKNMFSTIPDYNVYANSILLSFTKAAVPYPFTYTVLEYIKSRGLKVGIVTNGREAIQKPKLEMLELKNYTDAIVIPSALGIPQKPAPEPFLKAAELLSVKPENLLYVGDQPINDIDGSRNAGYTPVWVKTHGVWNNEVTRADYEIDSINEIPALIDSLLG